MAGVCGSVLTGWASDRFFQSRRAPMAGILYAVMLCSAVAMVFGLGADVWVIGTAVVLISASVIGVHGIMSGTSTVDFGGTKNGGAAVGIVDGLVYLGTAMQSLAAGYMTPTGEAAKDPANWIGWPVFLVPFAFIGGILTLKIWGALPRKAARPAPAPEKAVEPELAS
jgi:OPA family glycerol-3-phosphate transporter-like MFS transporter